MDIVHIRELTREHIVQADFIFAVYDGKRLGFLYEPPKISNQNLYASRSRKPKTLEVVLYDPSEDALERLREKIHFLFIES